MRLVNWDSGVNSPSRGGGESIGFSEWSAKQGVIQREKLLSWGRGEGKSKESWASQEERKDIRGGNLKLHQNEKNRRGGEIELS